jgi:muconolactone delta-isomerase
MKYVMTWWERPTGSAADYEQGQKRVLELFQAWQMPETLTFHQFLVRVGEFGGCAVIETDDPAALHQVTSAFAVFQFRVDAVMDVMDAVAAEATAIAWRDSLAAMSPTGTSASVPESQTAVGTGPHV